MKRKLGIMLLSSVMAFSLILPAHAAENESSAVVTEETEAETAESAAEDTGAAAETPEAVTGEETGEDAAEEKEEEPSGAPEEENPGNQEETPEETGEETGDTDPEAPQTGPQEEGDEEAAAAEVSEVSEEGKTLAEEEMLLDTEAEGTYTISYELNGGENSGENPAAGEELPSPTSSVKLKDASREGYIFAGWYSDSGFKKRVTAIAKGQTGALTLYAKWTAYSYSVLYNSNGGKGTMAATKCSYDTGRSLSVNTFKKSGYRFTCWNTEKDGSGTTYEDGADIFNLSSEKNGRITLYAQWEMETYSISYVMSGTEDYGDNPTQYDVTTPAITLKAPGQNPEGYSFGGWYSNEKLTKKVTKIIKGSTGDLTLYVKWVPNTYRVLYDANGGKGTMAATKCTYDKAAALRSNTMKRAGYVFSGWNTKADGSGDTYGNSASITNLTAAANGSVTLYAQWTTVTYSITYNMSGKDTEDYGDNPTQYEVTTPVITLKAPGQNPEGYSFGGWFTNKTLTKKISEIASGSTGNLTLYAKWIPNKYSITFDGNGADSGTVKAMNVEYGKTVKLTKCAFKKAGCVLECWVDDDGTEYKDQASVQNLTAENGGTVVLHARWKQALNITYNKTAPFTYVDKNGHYEFTIEEMYWKVETVNGKNNIHLVFVGEKTMDDGTGAKVSIPYKVYDATGKMRYSGAIKTQQVLPVDCQFTYEMILEKFALAEYRVEFQ